MKCYIHKDNEAIGCCKNCSKPVCNNCVIETGNGYACSENCKNKVLILNRIVYMHSSESAQTALKMFSIVFFIMALLSVLIPILTHDLTSIIVPIMFIAFSAILYVILKIRQKK